MFQFSPNFTESISKMFHERLYTTNWLNKYTLTESRKKKDTNGIVGANGEQ